MSKKMKFDAEKYIDVNYVEDECAIISIYIDKTSDYYNEFDADDLTLSDDILDFINNRVAHISYKYKLVLEFDTPKISDAEKEKILTIIKAYYGLAYVSNNKATSVNKRKALIFFMLGIIFLLLSHIAKIYDLVSEILSIAGWVSIWETVSVLLFDNFDSKNRKNNIDRLYNAKVVFKERKDD